MDYTPATLAGAGLEQVNHVKLHAGQVGLVAEYEDKFGAYSEKRPEQTGASGFVVEAEDSKEYLVGNG